MKMQHEERFKKNLESLAGYIVDVNDGAVKRGVRIMDSGLLRVGSNLVSGISAKTIIETFISKSNKSWENIRLHDQVYFNTKALDFFAGVPEEMVVKMRTLLMGKDGAGNYYVGDDVRVMIWKYLESFVKMSLKYLSPDGKALISREEYAQHLESWGVQV